MKLFKKIAIITGYIAVFWGLLPGFLIGISYQMENSFPLHLPYLWSWVVVGSIVLAFGAFILMWSMGQLWFQGKGLPISHLPPTQFVAVGLYKVWRHPIYVGYTLAFVGGFLVFQQGWGLLISVPFLTFGWFAYTKYYEEPVLCERFGDSYRDYRKETSLLWPASWHRFFFSTSSYSLIWKRIEKRQGESNNSPIYKTSEKKRLAIFFVGLYIVWGLLYSVVGSVVHLGPTMQWPTFIDKEIPFVPNFEFIYFFCYIVPFLPLLFSQNKELFQRFIIAFITMNILAFLLFLLLPVGIQRPSFEVTNVATFMLSWEYKLDLPVNCFPSLHAAIAWLVFLVCRKKHPRWSVFLFLTAIGIGLGALFVKQHYIVDIIGGKMLASSFYAWSGADSEV